MDTIFTQMFPQNIAIWDKMESIFFPFFIYSSIHLTYHLTYFNTVLHKIEENISSFTPYCLHILPILIISSANWSELKPSKILCVMLWEPIWMTTVSGFSFNSDGIF